MFLLFLFVYSIHSVISLSSQEDLSITKYSQIGCVKFKSDKQFLLNHIQENFLLPYQTFSSPLMTTELCFRLCRRWFILIFNNQKNCICLYTINKPYEINEYLGEFLSKDNCSLNDVQIYSLTEDISVFPSLVLSTSDDWSFDGCYYLHGIQSVRANIALNQVDYIQAIDLCRKHCQTFRERNSYSYFLSRRKSCYCLPLKLSQTIKTVALRKPLIHCSFHPYICQGFSNSCQNYYSETNLDTLMKIDVQHYCLSTEFTSFVFDQIFYRCFSSLVLQTQINFATINYDQNCLPLSIKTEEQWNYLLQSSWIIYSKLFISIDRNSIYIYNDLFKDNNLTLSSNNLCLSIHRTESNQISYELISCTDVRSPGYVLCVQKPYPSVISHEEEFQMINNTSQNLDDEILSCPLGFVLFNRMCYYIHLSFVYNIRIGERLCYNQNPNSTLVKFDFHEWGNINATRFLGRTYDDILLEFFYYLLEKKLLDQTVDESNRKHWLRLLLGDKNDPNECVLRYFARVSGAFTIFHRCNNGGHPVCQSEPIRTEIPRANKQFSDRNNSSIERKTDSTRSIIPFNPSDLLTTTTVSICENCTANLLADEDLLNNETEIDNNTAIEWTNAQSKKKDFTYRPLVVILTGPVLAFGILLIGIGLLIRHLRQNHGSYSARSSIVEFRRTKRSSTTVTTGDLPNTPNISYPRLKPSRVSFSETDMLLPVDNSAPSNGETIELLSATKVQVVEDDENRINEVDEETAYATLN